MSYTTSIIATQGAPSQLRDAFLKAWPELHLVDEAPSLQSLDEFEKWSQSRRSWAHDTQAIYRDGPWAVLLDLSTTLSADETELANLSRILGRVFVGTTQGTSGFAEIVVLDSGKEIRRITSVEGELTQEGTPLPEESGLDLDDFYMGANEEIAHRLGLASFWGEVEPPIHALHFVDRSVPETRPPQHSTVKKPWWRFW